MKLYPCGRKQLKLAAVVMTIVLFYVYFKRSLSVSEIRGASVAENYRVRKIDHELDSGPDIHVGRGGIDDFQDEYRKKYIRKTDISTLQVQKTYEDTNMSVPAQLVQHLPKKFRHDSCRRLPTDRVLPLCSFCRSFDMDTVTIYWDNFEKTNNWLQGSVDSYIEQAKVCQLPGHVKCIMNHDNPSSDAVVKFYKTIEESIPRRTCYPQIVVSLNSEAEYEGLDHGYSQYTEIMADYHLDSSIKLLYSCWNIWHLLRVTLPDPKQHAGVAMFISNCGALERIQYLSKLSTYVKIDSYGTCLHNMDKPSSRKYGSDYKMQSNWVDEFLQISSKYRMVIAYENTVVPEYISEKVFMVLRSGAIPVYRGPPEIYQHIPGRHTIINIDDYKTPEDLGRYMNKVLLDDSLYTHHTSLDKEKLRVFNREVCEEANQPIGCQMCNHVYKMKLASYKGGGRPCNCFNP